MCEKITNKQEIKDDFQKAKENFLFQKDDVNLQNDYEKNLFKISCLEKLKESKKIKRRRRRNKRNTTVA